MRIRYWSSNLCSPDLFRAHAAAVKTAIRKRQRKHALVEQGRGKRDAAVTFNGGRITIEQHIVLTTDAVDVSDRQTRLLHPRREHVPALRGLAGLERRSIDVEQQLGACGLGRRRRIRTPDVFTNA